MAENYVVFGPSAAGTLVEMAKEWQQERRNTRGLPGEPFTKFGPFQFRLARTTICDEFPTYPDPPANTFCVEFGSGNFTETPGCQSVNFTPYNPAFIRVAHDIYDNYWPRGTVVYCFNLRGQWHIMGAIVPEFAEATLNQDMCWDTEDVSVTDVGLLLNGCDPLDNLTAKNPRRHQGKVGYSALMIRKKCGTQCGAGSGPTGSGDNTDEWQIFDVQKRGICMVNGMKGDPEDGDGCLKYGSVVIAAEWCDAGEPAEACRVVDYTECEDTTSGEPLVCDLTWDIKVPAGTAGSGSGEEEGCC